MLIIQVNTAKDISFGPFVDPTDGKTPVITLVASLDDGTTGIKLSKNGGALTVRHAAVTASTYDAFGNYIVHLDTTDTNTVGTLRIQYANSAVCLPVWMDVMVVGAAAYDSDITGNKFTVPDIWTNATRTLTAATNITITNNPVPDLDTLIGTPVVSVSADIASLQTDADNIQTRLPVALVGGLMNSAPDWSAIQNTGAAINLSGTQIGQVNGSVGSVTTNGITSGSFAANSITSTALDASAATEIANSLFDQANGVETGFTFRQIMKLVSSALFGKLSGVDTNAPTFRDINDTANRITATTAPTGRTSITLNP